MTHAVPPARLTLGPLLLHWPRARRRDFYARIADEAPVDCVYLGEVACSKRLPWYEEDIPDLAARLRRAGKQVVISTPALITTDREAAIVHDLCEAGDLIEINDLAALNPLAGQKFVAGPLVNVFNEGALDVVRRFGAIRVALPVEIPATAIVALAGHNAGGETEVFIFGRQPLAISQRCYHARVHDLHKDSCQFVCGQDADGLPISQLDGTPLFALNGTQTLSHGYVVLLDRLAAWHAAGVTHFRLSPQAIDMVAVAELHRAVLDGTLDPEEGETRLAALTPKVPFINGFARGAAGMTWQPQTQPQPAA